MNEIKVGEVYQTRRGNKATVYWRVLTPDPKTNEFQWHVRDDRGYNWSVTKTGKYCFSEEEHPLDLIKLLSFKEIEAAESTRFSRWKSAPER